MTHNACITNEIEDFTRPVFRCERWNIPDHFRKTSHLFRCPIRTVKDAGPNGTDYIANDVIGGEVAKVIERTL